MTAFGDPARLHLQRQRPHRAAVQLPGARHDLFVNAIQILDFNTILGVIDDGDLRRADRQPPARPVLPLLDPARQVLALMAMRILSRSADRPHQRQVRDRPGDPGPLMVVAGARRVRDRRPRSAAARTRSSWRPTRSLAGAEPGPLARDRPVRPRHPGHGDDGAVAPRCRSA